MNKKTAPVDVENQIVGAVCLRKERRKRQKLLLIELLYEYAKYSTLHGLRYLVERGLHSIERCFWILTFLISISMCSYLINNVWIKWQTTPVIVSFSGNVVPVSDVPFPSVTICPQIKSKATVFNYTKELENLKNNISTSKQKLDNIGVLCSEKMEGDFVERNYSDKSIIDDLFEVAPTINDTIVDCLWRGRGISCKNAFQPVLTSEGVCYNFNALAASEIFTKEITDKEYGYLGTTRPSVDWSVTEGYTDFTNITYPRRGRENNAEPDLSVWLMETPEDRDGTCNSMRNGFTIYVQHPSDLPQASLYYYAALSGQVSALALKFNMLTTAEGLKKYDANVRQCYFPSDKELRYFRIYTANNCRLECQANYTYERCGCVSFHMPHHDSQRICTKQESIICVAEALDELSLAEIGHKNKRVSPDVKSCGCLPSCNSVTYDAEILKTALDIQTYMQTQEKLNDYNYFGDLITKNISRIDLYFKEPRFMSMHRSELFGVTDFLANCGGLLGLFLGFSFLSLVEIFYFGTLRLFYILKRDLREEKQNAERNDSIVLKNR